MGNEVAKKRVIVVGGGIAGLSTAWLIRDMARKRGEEIELTILEAKAVPGGATRTDHREGYACEWGPNGFLDNEPTTLELIELLGLKNDLVKADESSSNRYIYHGGAMRKVPMKPPQFLVSDILPLTSKLRMAMEPFIAAKRNGHEETVDSFGRRRLGDGFATYMLDPMVSGIFAGNTKELSLEAVFPKMVSMEREYGGLFKAMIAKKKEAKKTGKVSGGPSGPSATLHTFKKGMGQLTGSLAADLIDELYLDTPVQSIEKTENGFIVTNHQNRWEADAVVLACPSYVAAQIIWNLDKSVSESIASIHHAPVDVVCHGHRKEDLGHDLNGFGVLIPRNEHIRSLGTLWSDSIFPGQAPENHKLLRTIVGGAHDPEVARLSEAELNNQVFQDHRRVMGIKDLPVFKQQFRHPHGIAQYNIGHLSRVAKTEKLEDELSGLFFTGASYRGVSVNGCVKDAFRVANSFWDQQ
ncbi:protoporphyrinogen oxidase [bacterium]|nr:protoporphyrinogen oxidase [bacterium]